MKKVFKNIFHILFYIKRRGAASPRLVVLGTRAVKNVMFYVYLIYSNKNKRIYKGFTKDLKNRMEEHNCGRVKSTKPYKPWKLLYYESFINETDARREELFLKSGKGKDRIKYILENTLKIK